MGRIYVQGQTKWEQSTPTPYGAVLQKLALKLQDKYSDVLLLQQDVEEFKGVESLILRTLRWRWTCSTAR